MIASHISRSRMTLGMVSRALTLQQRNLTKGFPSLQQNDNRDMPASISMPDTYTSKVQSAQSREHEFSTWRAQDTVDVQVNDVSGLEAKDMAASAEVVDCHAQHYDESCRVSLHSVMQSNVPEPYLKSNPTHLNMPGSGSNQRHKVASGHQTSLFDSQRCTLHTSAVALIAKPTPTISINEGIPPAAQGIQGDECVMYRLFMENCHRYNMDCDEMLEGIQTGRRTLAQVFAEQEEAITKFAETHKVSSSSTPLKPEVGSSTTSSYAFSSSSDSKAPPPPPAPKLSQRERLKRAVKEYGTTVIVFHVGISLVSLGGFYVLVSR